MKDKMIFSDLLSILKENKGILKVKGIQVEDVFMTSHVNALEGDYEQDIVLKCNKEIIHITQKRVSIQGTYSKDNYGRDKLVVISSIGTKIECTYDNVFESIKDCMVELNKYKEEEENFWDKYTEKIRKVFKGE